MIWQGGRSEGLAIASYHAFVEGVFSSDYENRSQIDGKSALSQSTRLITGNSGGAASILIRGLGEISSGVRDKPDGRLGRPSRPPLRAGCRSWSSSRYMRKRPSGRHAPSVEFLLMSAWADGPPRIFSNQLPFHFYPLYTPTHHALDDPLRSPFAHMAESDHPPFTPLIRSR